MYSKLGLGIFLVWSMLSCSGETPAPEKSATAAATPEAPSRVILVTGATGTQGGAVARELLSRGYAVRGLTRNPDSERAQALKDAGAVLVQGDFSNPESLASAMDGAYGVFAMTDFWEHGYETEVAHGRQLVDSAAAASVQHFVYTSVAGAHQNTGIPHFDSKFEVEQYLANAKLAYTVVRPVSFLDNWRYAYDELQSGEYADPRDSDSRHQWIAARDIGFLVAEAFDNPSDWQGQSLDIAGEEMTLGEFLQLVAVRLGRPVVHKQVSWKQYEQDAGAEMTVMTRWFQDIGYSANVEALRAKYPNLTSAESYLAQLPWGTP